MKGHWGALAEEVCGLLVALEEDVDLHPHAAACCCFAAPCLQPADDHDLAICHNKTTGILICQKTREGCGCFWGLFGSSGGKLRESSGKFAGKFFPDREMLQILGFRAPGKANLPGTLGPHCRDLVPTFRAGCFLKSTVPAFSSFS